MSIGGTGCDVLIQMEEQATCLGFTDIGLYRPVRILVRSGTPSSSAATQDLFNALVRAFRSLGTEVPGAEMPCGGSLRRPCMAGQEPHTLNVLAWVGSNEQPAAVEDSEVTTWLRDGRHTSAISIVPVGVNPDTSVPASLRQRQVVWWGASPDSAALDVMVAAEIATAERRIFVSYSHQDGIELAHAVFHALSEARFSVFLDACALTPGSDFAERIEHELLDKAFMVLIETPEALASSWVLREVAFARQHRLGIATVCPGVGGARLAGIGSARRWTLPARGFATPGHSGPALTNRVAEELREFVIRLHGEAMLRRRQALDGSLRAALRGVGVSDVDMAGRPGGLDVNAGSVRWSVSLRPRPATLIDMHSAARQTPSGHRSVMVSATPRGLPERQALDWLAGNSKVHRWDEGRLLSLARELSSGRA